MRSSGAAERVDRVLRVVMLGMTSLFQRPNSNSQVVAREDEDAAQWNCHEAGGAEATRLCELKLLWPELLVVV